VQARITLSPNYYEQGLLQNLQGSANDKKVEFPSPLDIGTKKGYLTAGKHGIII